VSRVPGVLLAVLVYWLLCPQLFITKDINMEAIETKVTLEHLSALIEGAEMQCAVFWEKELVVSYKLPNGFTVLGRAGVVDPKNFVFEIGRDVAKKDAINQLWQLEGYLLQERLFRKNQQDNSD